MSNSSGYQFEKWQSKYPDSWFSCVPGKNGFLPVSQPINELDQKYQIIDDLLNEMRITQKDGSQGLLAKNKFAEAVDERLPLFDFSDIKDIGILAALLRDYYFMSAAYSLESSHFDLNDGVYGQARVNLPKQLAVPLKQLAEKNGVFPWMDYAHGYGLNNAVLKDGADPTKQESYETIRMFNGHESESGFINVHVAIDYQSGALLQYQQETLESLSNKDQQAFTDSLTNHADIFENMVSTLQSMWKASRSSDYLSFRTFIMGHKGNKVCYPDEHIVLELGEGVNETHSYRGETGAQDSIIPSVDNFVELEYPINKLTEYLYDLRKYRPKDHQEYIEYNKYHSSNLGFKNFAKKDSKSAFALLRNLDCLRAFRSCHWNLTKSYIINNTKHPVATGGTPITTWLPNQLGATLDYMSEVVGVINIEELSESDQERYVQIKKDLENQKERIFEEVRKMQEDFVDQE